MAKKAQTGANHVIEKRDGRNVHLTPAHQQNYLRSLSGPGFMSRSSAPPQQSEGKLPMLEVLQDRAKAQKS